jgi:hypothetical protein
MTTIKPMLEFITTAGFGQLVTVEAIDDMLKDVDGMDLVEHSIMEGSVDTYWQAAYLSVLILALIKRWKERTAYLSVLILALIKRWKERTAYLSVLILALIKRWKERNDERTE